MKIELSTLIPVVALAGGIIFTYGQLTSKVDSFEYLKELSDDNMNSILILQTEVRQLKEIADRALDIYSRSD